MKKKNMKTVKIPSMEDFFRVCKDFRTDGVDVYDEDTDSRFHMEVDMDAIVKSDYCNPDGTYTEGDSLEYYMYGVFELILKREKDCDSFEVYCESYGLWEKQFSKTREAGEYTPDDSELPYFALYDALEYWIGFDLRHLAEENVPDLKLVKN